VPELAEIFRLHAREYRQRFGSRILPSHQKVLTDLQHCRTPYFGGHLLRCDRCGKTHYSYHSCKNRHCPKCQGEQSQKWLDRQRDRLLPCSYYLLTATLPADLRPLARSHQKLLYAILMQSAAAAILKLTRDPPYLGAVPGILGVLHTWTRALLYHPHVHFLVTAGGIASDGTWRNPKHPRFLIPLPALAVIFRGKFRQALRKEGILNLAPPEVWKKKWILDCRPAGSGREVLDYLGRYLFRVAISNSRIESIDHGRIRFRYRDNKTRMLRKVTLPAVDFIGRFLQHVLPRRFRKVRYCGIFGPSASRRLERAREALAPIEQTSHGTLNHHGGDSADPVTPTPEGMPGHLCPFCHQGTMCIVLTLRRMRGPP
jgi:hypothetical protein